MADNELPVLSLHYDFLTWYADKLGKYPQKYRYNIGERILNNFLDILRLIIRARYSSKKKSHFLREANIALEEMRYLVRLSKDLQCITIKEYEYSARKLHEIGSMVGGWEKFSNAKESDGEEV